MKLQNKIKKILSQLAIITFVLIIVTFTGLYLVTGAEDFYLPSIQDPNDILIEKFRYCHARARSENAYPVMNEQGELIQPRKTKGFIPVTSMTVENYSLERKEIIYNQKLFFMKVGEFTFPCQTLEQMG